SRGASIASTDGALAMQSGTQMTAANGIHVVTTGALTARTLTTATGDIFAAAGGDAGFTTANVTATTGSGKVTLKSTGGTLSLDGAAAQGTVELDALGTLTPTRRAPAPSRGANIAATAGALDMQSGTQMTAANGINVQTAGMLTAKALTTATGD